MALIIIPGPLIPAGGFLSNAVNVAEQDILRIIMPDAWTAAPVTFQLSPDGTTFYDLWDNDGVDEVQMVVTPNAIIVTGGFWSRSIANIKFRSGTSRNPIVQPANRSFRLVTGK